MTEQILTPQSNTAVQILFEGAKELLGVDQMRRVLGELVPLEMARSGFAASHFLQTLESIYGVSGGRGLALCVGRAVFRYGIKQFGDEAGLNSQAYRLLPTPRKIEQGLIVLAHLASERFGDDVSLSEGETYWTWQSNNCPVCRGRHVDSPCCYLTVGMLQEFMLWAGNGRFYRVNETHCCAVPGSQSAACIFRIDKQPLD
ncbi:MAG: hypothetical protein GX491_20385 [Chloroflexi bacterium]|nr:hypothetical protein [Chloroflexota bacterium]